MKTRPSGSRAGCPCFTTSGRSCSLACAVIFTCDPCRSKKRQRCPRRTPTLLGWPPPQFLDREVGWRSARPGGFLVRLIRRNLQSPPAPAAAHSRRPPSTAKNTISKIERHACRPPLQFEAVQPRFRNPASAGLAACSVSLAPKDLKHDYLTPKVITRDCCH